MIPLHLTRSVRTTLATGARAWRSLLALSRARGHHPRASDLRQTRAPPDQVPTSAGAVRQNAGLHPPTSELHRRDLLERRGAWVLLSFIKPFTPAPTPLLTRASFPRRMHPLVNPDFGRPEAASSEACVALPLPQYQRVLRRLFGNLDGSPVAFCIVFRF